MHRSTISPARFSFVVLLVLICAGPSARAETLRWKFRKGEALHWVLDLRTVITEIIDDRENKETRTETFDMTWLVNDVAEDGSGDLTLRFDRVRSRIVTPIAKIEYDSKSGKKPDGQAAAKLHELMRIWVGAEFKCRMSPDGKVSNVRLPESFVTIIKDLGKSAQQGGPPPPTEEDVKARIVAMSQPLPKDDLPVGKSWTERSRVPAPPDGTMVVERTFKYLGPEKVDDVTADRLNLSLRLTLEIPATATVKAMIKDQDGKGVLYFDHQEGRIVKSNWSEKLEMEISDKSRTMNRTNERTTSLVLARVDKSK